MLPESLPPCIQGTPQCKWEAGGGHFGGTLNYQNFKCACGQAAILLEAFRQKPLLICPPRTEQESSAVNDALNDYVNTKLLAFWRHAEENEATPGIPPEVPKGFTAIVHEGASTWNIKNTTGIVAPEDPIFTKHKKFWAILLAQLGIRNYRTIKNEYCGTPLEPWYEFQLYGCIWKMGPRKRVFVIEVKCPEALEKSLDFTPLKLAAKTDQATFYDNTQLGEVCTVGVHAWGRKKLLEYFYLMLSPIAASADDAANSLQFPEPAQVEAPKSAALKREEIDLILRDAYEGLLESLAAKLAK